MASKVPNVKLNNGQNMPIIGLGTWNSPKGEVAQAVKDAIDAGYRHVDGAYIYGNEHEVGEGVTAKIAEGIIKREDIFITSKLWNTFHCPNLVRGALETTLKNLNTSYVDMYLMHWPLAYKEGGELFPTDANGKIQFSDVDFVDTWREMEKAVDDGLAKGIGASNFNKAQIERILSIARIPPAVNQIECHPYLSQQKLSAYCVSKGIPVTAYSPLGSPTRPWATANDPILMDEPTLIDLSKKYDKSVGQILIRYQVQRGHIVIPKSVSKARIISNFDVFGFKIDADDVKKIGSLERNGRFCPMNASLGHKYHPFQNDEF